MIGCKVQGLLFRLEIIKIGQFLQSDAEDIGIEPLLENIPALRLCI